jgi:hypothetical protein
MLKKLLILSLLFSAACGKTDQVTAEEMIQQFKANESKSVQQYLDKKCHVIAQVHLLDVNKNKELVVSSLDIEDQFNIQFLIPLKDSMSVKSVKTGNRYLFEGTCVDAAKGRGIVLSNCVVSPKLD